MSFSLSYELKATTPKGTKFLKQHYDDQASLKTRLQMRGSGISTEREIISEEPYAYNTTVKFNAILAPMMRNRKLLLMAEIENNIKEIMKLNKLTGKDVKITFKEE